MPLLYNEDKALKLKLQGLTVDDATMPNGRPVAVRYREPEQELADQTFPLLVIDHADITYDPARAHVNYVQLSYAPEGYPTFPGFPNPADSPYWTEYPLPMFVDYIVTLYCRKALHRAQLIAQLLTFDYLPPRFGFLVVPEDQTIRRLDVVGGPTFTDQLDAAGKRMFLTLWRLRTTTEILWAPVDQPVPATDIALDVTVNGDNL